MAESVLGLPARIGMTVNINGLKAVVESPIYSTGVGFVTYAAELHSNRIFSPEVLNGVFGRMKDWVKVYSDKLFKVR